MKTLGKWALMLITVLPAMFFASCNDDDDDNNNKPSNTPQIKEVYDKQGNLMLYEYDKKNRIKNVLLFDDGYNNQMEIGYNPLKLKRYRIYHTSDHTYKDDEQVLYDDHELARITDIKTDKNGNLTSCTATKPYGVAKANLSYDSEGHLIKVVQDFSGDYTSTDIAELTWVNGNMTHYTVSDEDGLYLESFVEYGTAVNITGQATYGMALAFWGEVEYLSGVVGKLSKNLPKKLTKNYHVNAGEPIVYTDVYNISYSFYDDGTIAEEYLENKEKPFILGHNSDYVKRFEVYYEYTK